MQAGIYGWDCALCLPSVQQCLRLPLDVPLFLCVALGAFICVPPKLQVSQCRYVMLLWFWGSTKQAKSATTSLSSHVSGPHRRHDPDVASGS